MKKVVEANVTMTGLIALVGQVPSRGRHKKETAPVAEAVLLALLALAAVVVSALMVAEVIYL